MNGTAALPPTVPARTRDAAVDPDAAQRIARDEAAFKEAAGRLLAAEDLPLGALTKAEWEERERKVRSRRELYLTGAAEDEA